MNSSIPSSFTCSDCHEVKPREDFGKDSRRPYGVRGICKSCSCKRTRDYVARTGYRGPRYPNDPVRNKNQKLKSSYRMDLSAFNAILENQGFVCANPGCQNEPTQVDHDHSCCNFNATRTAQTTCGCCTRGILCSECNRALAALKDDPKRILGLASYLDGGPI